VVEKVYYCTGCKSIYEKIDEIICSKCNIPLIENDFLTREDIGAYLKERGFHDKITKFYSKK